MTTPTSLRGYADDTLGFDGYGALVDAVLEHVPDLAWPRSIKTYSRMRNDPQLAAVGRVYTHPIFATPFSVDPAGCRDEVVAQTADDLGLPVLGADSKPGPARRRGFTWAEHLRLALLDLTFGHMFFEQQWDEADGQFRLGVVQERMPQTVANIRLNGDGTLKSVEQDPRTGQSGQAPQLTTSDHRLVYHVNDREGSNYFGRSLLRPAFGPWLIKDQVVRVHATSIRRFGMGIPYADAPPGATPQQVAEVQRLIATHKASEHVGAALPHGFTLKLAGLTGSVPDAVAFLDFLNREMSRMALASILDMATSENGARALGDTVLDVLMLALQSIADSKAGVGTSQIVVPLVTANWGEDEPAPRIVAGDVGQQREIAASELAGLPITHDPSFEAWTRSRYRIPAIDEAYVPQPTTELTTGAPGA